VYELQQIVRSTPGLTWHGDVPRTTLELKKVLTSTVCALAGERERIINKLLSGRP
jgi:hypothetical protein